MSLTRLSLLALLLAAPAQAQLDSRPGSIVLMVTVAPRLSIGALTAPRVVVRSSTEIEVVAEIVVEANTRYAATVRQVRPAFAHTASGNVRVAVQNAGGVAQELRGVDAVTIVSNGARSGRHEVRCRVTSEDPALLQPNRCALVFEVTSVGDERLLRANATLNLEDALVSGPRSSDVASERQ